MTVMNSEAPIVVAPRPVRLNLPDSSRVALPSEALDEFLSILTPAFLRKPRPFRPRPTDELSDPKPDPDGRWIASTLLSSPVSRTHTRNPFQRNNGRSPIPAPPLTPAAVPLPTPSPNELAEI